MKKEIFLSIATALLISACGEQKTAKVDSHVWMPQMFSDGMILQQNSEAPIWGKAAPGSQVSVQGSWGQSATATADNNGLWRTNIATPKFGGPYSI
ncbi:MAG: 9-O-acetylesterase, partial [Bacteroidales bacterium]|nr:9-O-acetylesterase [Bacteroidales bacterium]